MSGQNSIVVGFFGSTINHVRFQQPAIGTQGHDDALRSTYIAFPGRLGDLSRLAIYDYGRSSVYFPNSSVPRYSDDSMPTISPLFDKIAWAPVNIPGRQIEAMNPDGTGSVALPSGNGASMPRYSPDFQRIAYLQNGEIFVANASGSNPVALTNEASTVTCLAWKSDSSELIFGTAAGVVKRVTYPAGVVTTSGNLGTSIQSVDWAGNTHWLAINSSSPPLKALGYLNSVFSTTTQGNAIRRASFSPDGSKMVCTEEVSAGNWFITIRDAFDVTSTSSQVISEELSNTDVTPNWSRYLDRKTLVGSGGGYGATASGVLYSMTDGMLASFLSFASPNPSSVQVIKGDNSVPSQSILSVTINAPDGLSSLRYQNRLLGTMQSALSVSAEGAIVTYDADDGEINFILPFSDSVPSLQPDGTIKGRILGVFDADGKNWAPGGAKVVRLGRDEPTIQ